MEFLKKHYEKIILATFLLVFIVSLVLLIFALSKSMDIKEEDLKFPVKQPDYKKINAEDINYKKVLESEKRWLACAPRTEGDKDFTDLLASYQVARCPNTECQRLISRLCFVEGGVCPLCKFALHAPTGVGGGPLGPKDSNDNGIPDDVEKEAGLNPNDLDSGNQSDASGFTYLEKFRAGCSLKDPKSHPPFAKKIYLTSIKKNMLPIVLIKVTAHGDDIKTWTIQMDETVAGGTKTRFYKVGAVLNLNDRKYVIKDIKSEIKEEAVGKKGMDIVKKTVYSIVIQEEGDSPITAVEKQKVWESKETAKLVFSSDNKDINKDFTLAVNETFSLGDAKTGEEKYLVKSVSSANNKVILVRQSDNTEYEISMSDEPSKKEDVPDAERNPMMPPAGVTPPGTTKPATPGTKPTMPPGMKMPAGMPPGMPPGMQPGMPPMEPRNK